MSKLFSPLGFNEDTARIKALHMLLATTGLLCLFSIMIPAPWQTAYRHVLSFATSVFLFGLMLVLQKTKSVEGTMLIAAIGSLSTILVHFMLSGELYFLAIGITIPITSAIFLKYRYTIVLLAFFTVGTLTCGFLAAFGVWVPKFGDGNYLGGYGSNTITVVLIAWAIVLTVLWKSQLSDKLETIVNSYCDAILEADQSGLIRSASGELFKKLGIDGRQLVGRHFMELFDDDTTASLSSTLGDRHSFGVETKARIDGQTERWLRIVGTKTRANTEGHRWVLAIQDISAEVLSRNRLNEVSRLESLGEICGGLAHDFNNLLTVIGIYADMIEDKALRDNIQSAQSQAVELTGNLLAFARQQHAETQTIEFGEFLRSMKAVIERLVPANIKIDWLLDSGCFIKNDPAQLQQVVINLISNSIHAMPNGGVLKIRIARMLLPQSTSSSDTSPSEVVQLDVVDNGFGMSENTRRRALDPFFTTKPRGEGTGIGLSTVHGIVTKSDGSLQIESEPNVGTKVIVRFPFVPQPPRFSNGTDSSIPNSSIATSFDQPDVDNAVSGKRILLVEDREALREAISNTLRFEGFQVVEFEAAEDALELIQIESTQIDIIVSDVVLPGLSGSELRKRIRENDKDIKIILVSGYQQLDVENEMKSDPNSTFIPKPFRIKKLISEIESMDLKNASE